MTNVMPLKPIYLKRSDGDQVIISSGGQSVTQWPTEVWGFDLKAVTGLWLNSVGAAKDWGAQEMAMDIAGFAEQIVLE